MQNKEKPMKKFLAVFAIFTLVLAGCGDDDGNSNGDLTTTLRIKNESSRAIDDVKWNNVVFGSINLGGNVSKTVQNGSGYIYFSANAVSYRTNSLVVVNNDESAEFTFTSNTVIVGIDDNSTTTLGEQNEFIGTWTDSAGDVTMVIGNDTWNLFIFSYNFSGTWTRQGNVLTLSGNEVNGTATLAQGTLRLYVSLTDEEGNVSEPDYIDLTKGGTSFLKDARLTIQNYTTYKLTGVSWGNEKTFEELYPTDSSTKNVAEGSAYVSFIIVLYTDPRESGFLCRTQDMVTVSKGENKVYSITSNTLVVDLSDATNTAKTIQVLASEAQ
jgi:hypothetical protein